MRLSVIALDYDGTVATRDVMSAAVREVVSTARRSGLLVVLATGRLLEELRRVAGDLRGFDGVVAENGAVLYMPSNGHTTVLAPGIPLAYLAELRRLGVPHQAGYCLVDADANDAPVLLNVIRSLELPLVLQFNGGRVMTVPQGVSKATGLRSLLTALRQSPHNMLAIGDAENDHELLRLAEVGAAVEWGSPALRGAADVIVPGAGPPAVADYLAELVESRQLPMPMRARRRLKLGTATDGRDVSLGMRGRNLLVAGDARSGKSWAAGLLCEQLILQGYSVCIIDPEGDYRVLEALPGVTVVRPHDRLPNPSDLVRALRYPDNSLVIDLSSQSPADKREYISAILPVLNAVRRRTGLPHRIVVDEAHYFLDDDHAARLLDLDGHGYTFVTYQASRLPEAVLAATEAIIVTRESDPEEIAALRTWCHGCRTHEPICWDNLARLATAQAVLLPGTEEAGGELIQFTLAPRLTPHVRHRNKYVDVPVPDGRGFAFGASDRQGPRTVRTLRQFARELERQDVDGYLRRGDFSRWIGDVLGDRALAAELRELEARYRASPCNAASACVSKAIRYRYDLSPPDAELPEGAADADQAAPKPPLAQGMEPAAVRLTPAADPATAVPCSAHEGN
jgi:hydroxymethylpyrimidine pyrophosphatase-like HAD family hydrolase